MFWGKSIDLNPAQAKIVEILSDGLPRRLSEIEKQAEVSSSVVKTLVKHGVGGHHRFIL